MTIVEFPKKNRTIKNKKITITIPMNYEKIFKDDSTIKEHELY